MHPVSQTRLYVTADKAVAEAAFERLSARFEDEGFAVSVMEVDEKSGLWEACLYTPTTEKARVWKAMTACLESELSACFVGIEDLPDTDWVRLSLDGLKPVRAGRFLIHGSHDRDRIRPNDIAIEIDAGQAFGTGHHATTAGCLEMLERLLRRRHYRSVLDLGTGSGVLAIAVARLAHIPVLATDIDPVATAVARDNVRKNRCAPEVTVLTASGFQNAVFSREGPFDLIVANILAGPLMAMAPMLGRNLLGGADVILSGILTGQRRKVMAAFANQSIYHRTTLWRDGWVTLHLRSQIHGGHIGHIL